MERQSRQTTSLQEFTVEIPPNVERQIHSFNLSAALTDLFIKTVNEDLKRAVLTGRRVVAPIRFVTHDITLADPDPGCDDLHHFRLYINDQEKPETRQVIEIQYARTERF